MFLKLGPLGSLNIGCYSDTIPRSFDLSRDQRGSVTLVLGRVEAV